MTGNRIYPHDIDAEECVLGSILLDSNAITKIALSEKDFYSERNQNIFTAMMLLAQRNVSINQITVAEELARADNLQKVGGASYLSHLISVTPTSLDIEYYAEIVNRYSFSRKLIQVAKEIAELGFEAKPDMGATLSKADDLLLSLRSNNLTNPLVTPDQKQELLFDRYLDLNNLQGDAAISTGLVSLDKALGGGFYGGDLTIIAGRTGMGKTSCLLNLAENMSKRGNVLIFSCEMSVLRLGDKEISSKVGIPVNRLRMGKYGDALFGVIIDTVGEVHNIPIYTYDSQPITTSIITQVANSLYLRKGLSSVIVDHLGLLDDETGENRNLTLGYMTRKLKQLALKLNIPVLLAHQLSREVEKRDDKRPILSDLRESGRIEEDADGVIFLYRDSYYYDPQSWRKTFSDKMGNCPEYPENITEFILAKQRLGETNRIKTYFDKQYQKYFDLDTTQE